VSDATTPTPPAGEDPVGEHELPERHAEHHDDANRVVYVLIGVFVAIVLVVSIVAFDKAEDNKAATSKARQLQANLLAAGLPAPEDPKVLARAFGDDGGPVCENVGSELTDAILNQQLGNGAAGPGMRPITADPLILRGEYIVLLTYCPEKLAAFEEAFGDYDFDDVITGDDSPAQPEVNVIK